MRREAFEMTLQHQRPDHLILDLGGCPLSGMEGKSQQNLLDLLGYVGFESLTGGGIDERILKFLDIDTRGIGWIFCPEKSVYRKISDTEYIDEWGIRRVYTGLYWDIVDHPLRGATIGDLQRYPFPDPTSVRVSELDEVEQTAKRLYRETDYIICASHPTYGVFELACWLCGFDDFLMRMALEPEFVTLLFDRILEYQKVVSQMYYERIGEYIHYTSSGDDFATQQSTFVSPEMFREFIMPYFQERIRYTKSLTSAKFLHHSCGNVFTLIPDLIASGVEILNPIQPTNSQMAPRKLKDTYGRDIVFHGGFDTQRILPQGTRDVIRAEVETLLAEISDNGGYIFAAAHNIQEDVPSENIISMFQATRELYPSVINRTHRAETP